MTRARGDWRQHLHTWSLPPEHPEEVRCATACTVVTEALSHDALADHMPRVFAYGSCHNGTNPHTGAPVDVYVCDDAARVCVADAGAVADVASVEPPFADYFQAIERVLTVAFGRAHMRRSSHSFGVHAAEHGLPIQVTPCYPYRLYTAGDDGLSYAGGVMIGRNVAGVPIASFPVQQRAGCDAKDAATEQTFRGMARAIKGLGAEMRRDGFEVAQGLSPYLLENMVWNVDSYFFGEPDLYDRVVEILGYLWNRTRTDDGCGAWTESNGIKPLFHVAQPWSRDVANQFLYAAWNHVKTD